MLEEYWGGALLIVRVGNGLLQGREAFTREEIAAELSSRTGREITPVMMDGMEQGIIDIDEPLFNIWCDLFPGGKVKVLKAAQILQQNAGRSSRELLQEIVDDGEYEDWKEEQGE